MGRANRGDAGKNVTLLLVLLAILGGVGSWNYKRNLAAEEAQPRPYKSYTDEQLDQLLTAYQGQVEELEGRYGEVSGSRARQHDVQLLGDAVDQFNRVQRNSRAVRDLGSQLSQEQASLRVIQEEKALRGRLGGPTRIFLRRVFLPPM